MIDRTIKDELISDGTRYEDLKDELISDGTRYEDLKDGVWYRDVSTVFILEGGINRYSLRVQLDNNKKGYPEAVAEFIKQALNGLDTFRGEWCYPEAVAEFIKQALNGLDTFRGEW